jgi:hypothetical protein
MNNLLFKNTLIIFLILFCGACKNDRTAEYMKLSVINIPDVSVKVREKKAKFILGCLKNANPKSDEEPEDWYFYGMKTCEKMADNIYNKVDYGYTYYWIGGLSVGSTEHFSCSRINSNIFSSAANQPWEIEFCEDLLRKFEEVKSEGNH